MSEQNKKKNEKKSTEKVPAQKVEQSKSLGLINEINGYQAKIIINKEDSPNPIYGVNSPMPLYVLNDQQIAYVIYIQNLLSPAAELPALNAIDAHHNVTVIDPARRYILESALSSFQAQAVLITENAIPQVLSEMRLCTESEMIDTWMKWGFDHLKRIFEGLSIEQFKVFMRVFTELFQQLILAHEELRRKLVKVLVEICNTKNLSQQQDYLDIIRKFLPKSISAIVLDMSQSQISTLLNSDVLKYGDLLAFHDGNSITIAAIRELGLTAIVDSLFVISDGKPSVTIKPLSIACEGNLFEITPAIRRLYSQYDNSYIKIPVGKIPNTDEQYQVVLKANELIHFALTAISGSGKGNFLKLLIFEFMRMQAEYMSQHKQSLEGFSKLGMILFDDVGEYVKSLKPKDWGEDLASLVIKTVFDIQPNILIQFVEVGGKLEKTSTYSDDFKFLEIAPMFIPLEYIPVSEIMGALDPDSAGARLMSLYIEDFYNLDQNKHLYDETYGEPRMCLEFINWFFEREKDFYYNGKEKDDEHHFQLKSYNANHRVLNTFLSQNKKYLGLSYDRKNKKWQYMKNITAEKDLGEGHKKVTINETYNLVDLAENCANEGRILIIDESNLDHPGTKLLIQRILLYHILGLRENLGFNPNMIPLLFIIEEATALIRGAESKQLTLFNEAQVKARKFGIGMGLVLQDIQRLDPTLLTQLGWMITLGLPVNSMRSILFSNVPSDLGPYDDYIKHADIGMGVGFQKLVGKNTPLPLQIYHFEGRIKEILNDYIKKNARKDLVINAIERDAKECKIPQEVIDELLKDIKEEKK